MSLDVIVSAHLRYEVTEDGGTLRKGFPRSVGSANNPNIPTYFNIAVQAECNVVGRTRTRRIRLVPTDLVDLKYPVAEELGETVPLDTGLAKIFEVYTGRAKVGD